MLLSLAEVRALFETDLEDGALQRLLDAAEEEIVSHAGAHDSASDFYRAPLSSTLFLQRKATAIVSVTERVIDTETALAANDYRLVAGRELVRRNDGDNPREHWGDEVTVAYTPADDLETRKRVQADLVKLAAKYDAARFAMTGGNFSEQMPDYEQERGKLLSRLTAASTLGLA